MESKRPDTDKEIAKKCIEAMLGKGKINDIYQTFHTGISDNAVLSILNQSHNLENLKEYWMHGCRVGVDYTAPQVLRRVAESKLGVDIIMKSDWIIPSLFKILQLHTDLWEFTDIFGGDVHCAWRAVLDVIFNIAIARSSSSKKLETLKKYHPDFVCEAFATLFKCYEHYNCGPEVRYVMHLLQLIVHTKSDYFAEEIRGLTKHDFWRIVNMIPLHPSTETHVVFEGLVSLFHWLCYATGRKLGDVWWGGELLLKCENWLHGPIDESFQRHVSTVIVLIKRGSATKFIDATNAIKATKVTTAAKATKTTNAIQTSNELMRKISKHAQRDRRWCSANACSRRGLKTCSGCYAVYYCSAPCQRTDWKLHKKVCKESRNSAKGD